MSWPTKNSHPHIGCSRTAHPANAKPEYTDAERRWLYQILTGLATCFARQGTVLIAATGNRRTYREQARRLSPVFAEVYLDCPLAVCQSRDPKGQYLNADDKDHIPGIGVAYGHPFCPRSDRQHGR
ncbi:MAG: adenylyl-sulfate kinase [bacterium]|nr:adenylyl-sulfate kinase [bacterium]